MLASKIVNDPFNFHSALAKFNVNRLAVAAPSLLWEEKLQDEMKYRIIEGRFLEQLRALVIPLTRGSLGTVDHFVSWFESLAEWGPGQHHALFDWLAEHATLEEMRWFLTQEAAGEAGFEDLVAYTQVKLPQQAKLECARNYWDEMGRGKPKAMHGPLLESMVHGLELNPSIDSTVWESLALGNVMVGLATSRRYTYHSLGALGVIELTAPLRAAKVSRGMERLGMPRKMRAYFDLHAALDILHSREWIQEVIRPLVTDNPECAQFIAEGALMRLKCGQQCFDRYSQEFGINIAQSKPIERRREKRNTLEIVNC
ncbi:MAG: iron-containing redox enzyme family protein [Gammaproteobacteria bacterium]|nr:MAG: iron-containing redox enzyme family protein [Gammaproteobacteria bacterium]